MMELISHADHTVLSIADGIGETNSGSGSMTDAMATVLAAFSITTASSTRY